ncbi:CoA activase [Clostridia bacterium]|nr:CoA activase [Clostridia bacterium]
MKYIGIDIGSTASKVIVRGEREEHFTIPTGWNSKETSKAIRERLETMDIHVHSADVVTIATGYGRISVEYADKVVTEITCHGKGGFQLVSEDCTIIDVGGQDTKVINVENGMVTDFLMNDKCSAGTGKFIEIMANRLNVAIDELFDLAKQGEIIPISSLCTVFAESEIINYMGEGRKKEDIAAGVVDSVASKVLGLCQRLGLLERIIITGGLSHNEYFAEVLSKKLNHTVEPQKMGRYAGALGASLLAEKLKR